MEYSLAGRGAEKDAKGIAVGLPCSALFCDSSVVFGCSRLRAHVREADFFAAVKFFCRKKEIFFFLAYIKNVSNFQGKDGVVHGRRSYKIDRT